MSVSPGLEEGDLVICIGISTPHGIGFTATRDILGFKSSLFPFKDGVGVDGRLPVEPRSFVVVI